MDGSASRAPDSLLDAFDEIAGRLQALPDLDQTVGMLRSRSDLSSEAAFAMLVSASQRMNIKLREVARTITDRPDGHRTDGRGLPGVVSGRRIPGRVRRERAGGR